MNSSRIRTTCSSSRGGCTWSWGVYLVLGGVCSGGVSALGGRLLWGACTWSQGGVCSQGCLLQEWGCAPGQVLCPVDRHTPVNILPCPKLRLRAVINIEKKGIGFLYSISGSTTHWWLIRVTLVVAFDFLPQILGR